LAVPATAEGQGITDRAVAKLNQPSGQAADKLQAARQSTGAETSSSGGQPITVVPEMPTVPIPGSRGRRNTALLNRE
jgi:hypothetical protein